MVSRLIIASLVLSTACKPETEPAWALDPIYVEAVGEDIVGFQTWEVFGDRWAKKHKGKHYICAVVVEFTGTPSSCTECTHAWLLDTAILESDCPSSLSEDPLVLSLQSIGIGATTASDEAPYPGQSREGWADYGFGWEVHGWAYPDALDHDRQTSAKAWDASEPYALWPTAAWPL